MCCLLFFLPFSTDWAITQSSAAIRKGSINNGVYTTTQRHERQSDGKQWTFSFCISGGKDKQFVKLNSLVVCMALKLFHALEHDVANFSVQKLWLISGKFFEVHVMKTQLHFNKHCIKFFCIIGKFSFPSGESFPLSTCSCFRTFYTRQQDF